MKTVFAWIGGFWIFLVVLGAGLVFLQGGDWKGRIKTQVTDLENF